MAEITSMQGQCGHKLEGDIELGHSRIDNESLSCTILNTHHFILISHLLSKSMEAYRRNEKVPPSLQSSSETPAHSVHVISL